MNKFYFTPIIFITFNLVFIASHLNAMSNEQKNKEEPFGILKTLKDQKLPLDEVIVYQKTDDPSIRVIDSVQIIKDNSWHLRREITKIIILSKSDYSLNPKKSLLLRADTLATQGPQSKTGKSIDYWTKFDINHEENWDNVDKEACAIAWEAVRMKQGKCSRENAMERDKVMVQKLEGTLKQFEAWKQSKESSLKSKL